MSRAVPCFLFFLHLRDGERKQNDLKLEEEEGKGKE